MAVLKDEERGQGVWAGSGLAVGKWRRSSGVFSMLCAIP